MFQTGSKSGDCAGQTKKLKLGGFFANKKNLVCIFNSSAMPGLKKCEFARAQGWQDSVWETTWDQLIWHIFWLPCHPLALCGPWANGVDWDAHSWPLLLLAQGSESNAAVSRQLHRNGLAGIFVSSKASISAYICCHLTQGIKWTRVERRQYGVSAFDCLSVFPKGYCYNVAQTLL